MTSEEIEQAYVEAMKSRLLWKEETLEIKEIKGKPFEIPFRMDWVPKDLLKEMYEDGKKMPKQKPGKSEQVVCTPTEFLAAVKQRLGIEQFTWDLAATKDNSVAGEFFYSEAEDALTLPWNLNRVRDDTRTYEKQWNWCNPPYSKLGPWVEKARQEQAFGACTAMLVPASPGSNWWREWVHGKAYVTYLNGRITFIGHTGPFPKDLALLLYAPFLAGGECVWRWKG